MAELHDELGEVMSNGPDRDAAVSTGPSPGPNGGTGTCGEPQIRCLFCKPICKRYAVEQDGTRKTRRAARDEEPSRIRGHRVRERRPGTPETGVVVLITQRSRVQILPPLPNQQVRGSSRLRERPSCAAFAREIGAHVRHAPERDACPQSVASLLRHSETSETALAESLGAWPRDRRCVRASLGGLWRVPAVNCWLI